MNNQQNTVINLMNLVACLSQEIEYLHMVIDHMPGSIYWKDTQGVYRGHNAFARETIKKNNDITESIIGKNDFELFDAEDAKIFRKYDEQALQSGKTVKVVEEIHTKTGEKITQVSIKKPLTNQHNEVIGIIGNTLDITEHKRVEQELRDAKEKLEVANNIKNEFIGNMTHDIRTPLAAIHSLSEDILLHSEHDMLRKNARYLMRSGQQLLNYFERIFEVLCLESNKDKESKSCFSLHSSMQGVLDIVMVGANHKKIALIFDYHDNLPEYVKSYDTYIQRIVLNLLVNAVKFTERGRVTLTISLSHVDSDAAWVNFAISDTGIGISSKLKERIFDKFSRGSASYSDQHRGAGVGLYIVKNLIEEMGGSIKLNSQLNVGSTFNFRLPLEVATKNEAKEMLSAHVQSNWIAEETLREKEYFQTIDNDIMDCRFETKESIFIKNKEAAPTKVLLVEDNAIAQYAEKSKLSRLNCSVDVAADAKQALELLYRNDYHLVLCDVGLPDMNGFQLVQLMKKTFPDKSYKVILLTAHVDCKIDYTVDALVESVYKKPLLMQDANTILSDIRSVCDR